MKEQKNNEGASHQHALSKSGENNASGGASFAPPAFSLTASQPPVQAKSDPQNPGALQMKPGDGGPEGGETATPTNTPDNTTGGELDKAPAEAQDEYKSYLGKTFEIDNADAVIRDDDMNPLKYKKGDTIPEGKKEGDNKTIPNGTSVQILDVKVEDTYVNYVKVKDYGWTSRTNIKGGLYNETIGITRADAYESTDPNHKTVMGDNAIIRKESTTYPEVSPPRLVPNGIKVTITGKSSDEKYVQVKGEDGTDYGWTWSGNLNQKDPENIKVENGDARIREQKKGYASTKKKLTRGEYVIIKETSEDGKYVKVAYTKKGEEDKGHVEDTGKGAVWTSVGNLAEGWSDIMAPTAMWKDNEFIGHEDIVQVIGRKTNTSKDIGQVKNITSPAYSKYKAMVEAASADGAQIKLGSGFRTYGEQKRLREGWEAGKPGYNAANKPGDSEHQNGLAYDLNNKQDETVNLWLKKNAWNYGFVKTYSGYGEHHHWEYQPSLVKKPEQVTKNKGTKKEKTYTRYWFATYKHKNADYYRAYIDVENEAPAPAEDSEASSADAPKKDSGPE